MTLTKVTVINVLKVDDFIRELADNDSYLKKYEQKREHKSTH